MEDSGTDSRIKSRPFGAERVAFPAKTKPARGFRVDFLQKMGCKSFLCQKKCRYLHGQIGKGPESGSENGSNTIIINQINTF